MIIPNFKAKNIFEVDLEFYKSLGISFLICDLDNTLDVYTCKEPTERVVEFTKKLKESGLNLLICSNNSKKRVEKYAKILKVSFIYQAQKPFISKTKKYLSKNGINIDKCIFIGDQLLTDIKVANRLGMKSMFVEELENKNGIFTRINKKIETFYKKGLESSYCKNWEDIYVSIKKS